MFELQSHLDTLYQQKPRQLALAATTDEAFGFWRDALREKVTEVLHLSGRTVPTNPAAEHLSEIDRGSYVEHKYALDVGETVRAPMYVLVPKADPPYKAVMVFHGHNPSVQYILGNYPDEATAQEKRAIDNNYAQALAEAGFLVCAVEQRGFGERLTAQLDEIDYSRSCRHLAFEYMLEGRVLVGERVWDGMCAISYVQNRDDVVPGTLGCTGNSGGGTTALWLSALDERVTVSVPSCYLCSFKHSILGMRHCECNYVPGILGYAEMGELAALIAPRPFRAIAGEHDPIFPLEGVRQEFAKVQQVYDLLGYGDRCSLMVHPLVAHGVIIGVFARMHRQ